MHILSPPHVKQNLIVRISTIGFHGCYLTGNNTLCVVAVHPCYDHTHLINASSLTGVIVRDLFAFYVHMIHV